MDVLSVSYASDNYAYLIIEGRQASVVDPGDAKKVGEVVTRLGLDLQSILLTHHHSDHVGGAAKLSKQTGALIYAPNDKRIRPVDVKLHDGDRVEVPGAVFDAILTPGHSKKHMVYFEPTQKILFSGDLLFGAGCGRIFEGTAAQMYDSLMRIAQLGDQTRVYFGHEYTEENLLFALSIEPENDAVAQRLQRVRAQLKAGEPTSPSLMGEELRTNVFLRAQSPGVRKHLGMLDQDATEVFAKLRKAKDRF